jgi:hypothetical protein
MADSILNRDKHPEWQGERTKMIYAFPTNERLWDEYAKPRAESLKADGDGHEATDFYAAPRAEMDEGAVVAWHARRGPGAAGARHTSRTWSGTRCWTASRPSSRRWGRRRAPDGRRRGGPRRRR